MLKDSTIELLRKIQTAIRTEPKQFRMDHWFLANEDAALDDAIPQCGTACCIGGWAIALKHGLKPSEARTQTLKKGWYHDQCDRASEALELEPNQASRLFYWSNWPDQFCNYSNQNDPQQAIARIDYFIATGGTDGD